MGSVRSFPRRRVSGPKLTAGKWSGSLAVRAQISIAKTASYCRPQRMSAAVGETIFQSQWLADPDRLVQANP